MREHETSRKHRADTARRRDPKRSDGARNTTQNRKGTTRCTARTLLGAQVITIAIAGSLDDTQRADGKGGQRRGAESERCGAISRCASSMHWVEHGAMRYVRCCSFCRVMTVPEEGARSGLRRERGRRVCA